MKSILKEENAPLARLETFLSFAYHSVGCNTYRHLYVVREQQLEDVIGDGDLACALFASSMLTLCNLISDGVHTTVVETVNDLLASGWVLAATPAAGRIVVWGEKRSNTDNLMHFHIGICIDGEYAVSTSAETKTPIHHRIDGLLDHMGNQRKVVAYYVHPELTRVTF